MGYHVNEIERGVLGEPSKITEEHEEFLDALAQGNPIMALLELSDMIGAIEAYAIRQGRTLDDLIVMMRATKSAFRDGSRPSRDEEMRDPATKVTTCITLDRITDLPERGMYGALYWIRGYHSMIERTFWDGHHYVPVHDWRTFGPARDTATARFINDDHAIGDEHDYP